MAPSQGKSALEGARSRSVRVHLRRSELREDEIAAMVGTVRVHVSRSLKALARVGAITLNRDTICISDPKALEGFLQALSSKSTDQV